MRWMSLLALGSICACAASTEHAGTLGAGGMAGSTASAGAGNDSGGGTGVGGTSATGGARPTGGATGVGGTNASGGGSTTGGTSASGGVSSTGGATSSGGVATTGGTSSTGGATTTGGASSTGGSPASGGTGGSVGAPGEWVEITPLGLDSALGLAVSPAAPGTVYVNAKSGWPPSDARSGIFKSTDGGQTWGSHLGTTFYNYDGSAYTGGNPWAIGVSWTLAVDPTNADIVYAHCSFFGPQGLWKSTDGGTSWRQLFSSTDTSQMTADVYAIAIDPVDRLHLLVTFHSGWAFKSDAGVAETKDGGATWIQHAPHAGWGAGHYAFFLRRDDSGAASSTAWILATQYDGYWRTLDAGQTWTQVTSTYNMQHGAGGMYRASTGVLYMGAVNHLIRSTDNGKTWSDAGAPSNSDGYNTVIGDGTRMYVQSANTGTNTTGPQTFFTSLETDGTHWTAYNSQKFADGPGWTAYDANAHIVYASLWDHGLWRLKVGN